MKHSSASIVLRNLHARHCYGRTPCPTFTVRPTDVEPTSCALCLLRIDLILIRAHSILDHDEDSAAVSLPKFAHGTEPASVRVIEPRSTTRSSFIRTLALAAFLISRAQWHTR